MRPGRHGTSNGFAGSAITGGNDFMQTLTSTTATIAGKARTDAVKPAAAPPPLRPTICHVLHSLHVGGGEVLARAFALANADQFRPVFALLDDLGELGQSLREQGFSVEVIRRRPGFDRICARRLKQFFREHNVRLVHAHQYGPLFYSAMARLPWRKIPILFTEHGRDYPDFRRWKRVLANRLLLTSQDRFVAVGEGVRRALVDYEGLSASRVEVIYNGRDLSAYDPSRPLRDRVRQELGLDANQFVVIQVARLNRLKDHPTGLRAMHRLLENHPDTRLLLAGDGEDRTNLEKLADELGVQHAVRFLGSRNDVPRLLQAADAFLLSSISEGIPLTLIEAMATGLPIVATQVGGVVEVLDDGTSGLLADAGDDVKLASHLSQLCADKQLRERMGRAGQQQALRQFAADDMHARYRDLYGRMTDTVVVESGSTRR